MQALTPDPRAVYDRLLQRLTLPRAPSPMHEELPKVSEALAMFRGNPGLSSVMTEGGVLFRDGRLELPAWSVNKPE